MHTTSGCEFQEVAYFIFINPEVRRSTGYSYGAWEACLGLHFNTAAHISSQLRVVFFHPRDTMLVLVLAMAPCLCVSQVCVLLKRLNKSGCYLVWELPSTYPILCYKEIQVPSKIRVLVTFLQTLDLENFATAHRSSKRVINLARERWLLRAW